METASLAIKIFLASQVTHLVGYERERERERMSSFIPCGQREAMWVRLPGEHLQCITSVTPGALG